MDTRNIAKSNYLKGLDGLRALAAIGVLISHIYKSQDNFGLGKSESLYAAHSGVTIFFALSGFLITYLFLKEKETYQAVDIRSFYIRRILRIWPLYFFYISLCLLFNHFIFHFQSENLGYLILMALFLPNIVFNLNAYQPGTGALWSIGIEEQFYLFWPWAVRKFQNLKRFIIFFLMLIILIKWGAFGLAELLDSKLPKSIVSILGFDVMAIGGFFAVLYYENQNIAPILKYRRIIVMSALALYIATFFTTPMRSLYFLKDSVIAILTGLFIITQITHTDKFQLLENPVLRFLGKLSFGIYVYHSLVIIFFHHIVSEKWGFQFDNIFELIGAILVTTVLIAYISFHTLEKYFLSLKTRYSKL